MTRSFRPAVLVTAALGSLMMLHGRLAFAQQSLPVVEIKTLKNDGGLPDQKNRPPLNEQFTIGLTKYLTAMARGRFLALRRSPDRSEQSRARPGLTVEGELSRLETGATGSDGTYLCTLRLTQSVRPHRLLRVWMGMARTYLDLSSNLIGDNRVSDDGLVGELGTRLIGAVTASSNDTQAAPFATLLAAAPVNGLTAQLSPQGRGFQALVAGPFSGQVALVALDAAGHPTSLPSSQSGREATLVAESPALFPAARLLHQSDLPVGATRLAVLVRRALPPARATAFVRLGAVSNAAVQVLDTGPSPALIVPADPTIARILGQFASDPPGTWASVSLPLPITQ